MWSRITATCMPREHVKSTAAHLNMQIILGDHVTCFEPRTNQRADPNWTCGPLGSSIPRRNMLKRVGGRASPIVFKFFFKFYCLLTSQTAMEKKKSSSSRVPHFGWCWWWWAGWPGTAAVGHRRGSGFRTRSEVDVLDDGFKWCKYGKKAVQSSPKPPTWGTHMPLPPSTHADSSVHELLLLVLGGGVRREDAHGEGPRRPALHRHHLLRRPQPRRARVRRARRPWWRCRGARRRPWSVACGGRSSMPRLTRRSRPTDGPFLASYAPPCKMFRNGEIDPRFFLGLYHITIIVTHWIGLSDSLDWTLQIPVCSYLL